MVQLIKFIVKSIIHVRGKNTRENLIVFPCPRTQPDVYVVDAIVH